MEKKLSHGKIDIYLSFLFILSLSSNIWANDNSKERILEVKLNEEYVFGEGLNEEKDIAYGNALSDLLLYGNELKKEKNQQEVTLSDLQLNVETIAYFDGKRYEVIVYIPLDKLYNLQSKSPKEHEAITNVGSQSEMAMHTHTSTSYNPETENEIEDFLISQENFTEIKEYLSAMKLSGRIIETGALNSTSSLPEKANLILIDELGGILSILSPRNEYGRLNYRTRLRDEVNNYSDCKFIVWYTK